MTGKLPEEGSDRVGRQWVRRDREERWSDSLLSVTSRQRHITERSVIDGGRGGDEIVVMSPARWSVPRRTHLGCCIRSDTDRSPDRTPRSNNSTREYRSSQQSSYRRTGRKDMAAVD